MIPAMPPTTPPTIAPTGVDELEVEVGEGKPPVIDPAGELPPARVGVMVI